MRAVLLLCLLTFGVAVACAAVASGVQEEFERAVKPFFAGHCFKCHDAKKQKGDLRLDTLPLDFAGAKNSTHWADILDRINSGDMPPEEEKRPSAEASARVVEWIAAQLGEAEAGRLAKRERVTFHKLTRAEYANTIHDLLGVTYDAADPTGLLEDEEWHGFERIGSALSLSPAHVEKYFAAAETVLAEALPVKAPAKFLKRKDAIDLRGGPDRAALAEQGLADKVRVDLWPGSELQGGRPGPGQALPASGTYKVRIQLSGLKPPGGRAPHLEFYAMGLDRMLFEEDVIAPEDKPVVLEFETHLPAGNLELRVSNEVPGPSNLPRSGRADPRIPFISIKHGRRPWQTKLTDEEGQPLLPFLILDWIEWEGPIVADGPTRAQREYMLAESGNMTQAREALTRFAERAFRRPVRSGEVDRLVKLVESEMASGEKFDAAMKTALLAALCDKDFLYLVEGSEGENTTRLNDWEIASRLSYFLWSTMPDAALFEAARNGSLHEPAALKAQVARILRD
ncbi:MAG: DUF1587 domain-containing protein, partial [Verrucomicrobiota bacterium]|nr:DUF1587 domain-containing protein [Verrucomicrobiota bacterium]